MNEQRQYPRPASREVLGVRSTKLGSGLITALQIAAGAITADKIAVAAITATKLNIVLIIVVGATWTDNSPTAGKIAWAGATVYWNGAAFPITDSNTAFKYIWWSSTTSNTTFQASDTRPALTDDEFMIATNNGGIHDLVWNSTNPADGSVNPTHLNFESMSSLFIYGDGVDGDVTISANTTLTRDMTYNNLTINTGKVLFSAGYRIFVKNTLLNNGTIRHNGANAVSQSGGAGAAAGSMGEGSTGGNGGLGTPGNPGAALVNALGGVGGAGGAGGASAGGAGGTKTQTLANRHGLVLLSLSQEERGGTGGGAGGSVDGGAQGGGGGGGGGVIIIAARTITNNGTIEAKGGNGADGLINLFATGGGGGGAGGALVLVHRTLTTGTQSVSGGTFGLGKLGGVNGTVGNAGLVLLIQQES